MDFTESVDNYRYGNEKNQEDLHVPRTISHSLDNEACYVIPTPKVFKSLLGVMHRHCFQTVYR